MKPTNAWEYPTQEDDSGKSFNNQLVYKQPATRKLTSSRNVQSLISQFSRQHKFKLSHKKIKTNLMILTGES